MTTRYDVPCPRCGRLRTTTRPHVPCRACFDAAMRARLHGLTDAEIARLLALAGLPCPHAPGTPGRIEHYAARVLAGRPLYHPADARDGEGTVGHPGQPAQNYAQQQPPPACGRVARHPGRLLRRGVA